MGTSLNPYLSFRDTARSAMDFYQSIFGGEVTSTTFGEFQASQDPAEQDKIMHSVLTTEGGLVLMAADTPNAMDWTAGTNYSVSLSGDDADELRGYWDRLADGATIGVPLARAPWGDSFGMLSDRFGVSWLVNIAGSSDPTG